jgi:hemophore-related protein
MPFRRIPAGDVVGFAQRWSFDQRVRTYPMSTTRRSLCRVAITAFGAGAVLCGGASIANAEPAAPPPSCTAGDLAVASGTVGTAMGDYLFSHPDVNDFFTSLRGQPYEEIHDRVQTYMDAHPQTESEINGIRQPLTDLRSRCNLDAAPLGS